MARKATQLLLAVFLLITALALPAAADAPTEVEADVTFPAVNACTGEIHIVTLSAHISIHQHNNNSVATIDTTTETSDGGHGFGTETEVVTKKSQINTLNIRVSNGDWIYVVKGHRTIDLAAGEVTFNSLRNSCISS